MSHTGEEQSAQDVPQVQQECVGPDEQVVGSSTMDEKIVKLEALLQSSREQLMEKSMALDRLTSSLQKSHKENRQLKKKNQKLQEENNLLREGRGETPGRQSLQAPEVMASSDPREHSMDSQFQPTGELAKNQASNDEARAELSSSNESAEPMQITVADAEVQPFVEPVFDDESRHEVPGATANTGQSHGSAQPDLSMQSSEESEDDDTANLEELWFVSSQRPDLKFPSVRENRCRDSCGVISFLVILLFNEINVCWCNFVINVALRVGRSTSDVWQYYCSKTLELLCKDGLVEQVGIVCGISGLAQLNEKLQELAGKCPGYLGLFVLGRIGVRIGHVVIFIKLEGGKIAIYDPESEEWYSRKDLKGVDRVECLHVNVLKVKRGLSENNEDLSLVCNSDLG